MQNIFVPPLAKIPNVIMKAIQGIKKSKFFEGQSSELQRSEKLSTLHTASNHHNLQSK